MLGVHACQAARVRLSAWRQLPDHLQQRSESRKAGCVQTQAGDNQRRLSASMLPVCLVCNHGKLTASKLPDQVL